MACRDQIMTFPEFNSTGLDQGDLKFDLFRHRHLITSRMLHSLRKESFTPLDNDSGFLSQMKEKVSNLKYSVCCTPISVPSRIDQNGVLA